MRCTFVPRRRGHAARSASVLDYGTAYMQVKAHKDRGTPRPRRASPHPCRAATPWVAAAGGVFRAACGQPQDRNQTERTS